jgi:hypothetical protein
MEPVKKPVAQGFKVAFDITCHLGQDLPPICHD